MAAMTKLELEQEIERLTAELQDALESKDPDVDYSKMSIFQLLPLVADAVGAVKKGRSGGVSYEFRGIDATVNAVAPALRKYGVSIIPQTLEHKLEERQVGAKIVTIATVLVKYVWYASDGSHVETIVPGESADYSDKATAQAMSVASRIGMLQTLSLPTDSPDPELMQDNPRQAAPQATRAETSIAKAGDAGTVTPAKLQTDIKREASKLQMTGEQINTLASEVTAQPVEVWFNQVQYLVMVLDAIKAKAAENK